MAGTFCFYTDDSRFDGLWSHPYRILETNAVTVVEPNFSIYDHTPVAVGLYQIYRKRVLGRYWQSQGLRLVVDLNVAVGFSIYNLLGVPLGWEAYATRGSELDDLDRELTIARKHAGKHYVLFLVYGGGVKVAEWCQSNNAVWVPEHHARLSSDNGEEN
jgi:hypothetical protein